jgi:1-acyl-sn-glycerol-3-phosphate acyltransferase
MGERMASTRREPGLLEGLGHGVWSVGVGALLHCWHRLSIHGRELLPAQPPFVMIGNHTSHLDALTLASLVPRRLRRDLYPLAAGDVFFETPSRALLSALLWNALPMQRKRMGRHALDELRTRLLEDPCVFVLFPEGTRSATGQMLPFKPGLGMLVAGTEVPVVPCHLRGAFEAWPRTARLPRPRRVSVRVGEPLHFRDVGTDRAGWQEVVRRAEEAVRTLAAAHLA